MLALALVARKCGRSEQVDASPHLRTTPAHRMVQMGTVQGVVLGHAHPAELCSACAVQWCTVHWMGLTAAFAPAETHTGGHAVCSRQRRHRTGTFSFHVPVHMKYICSTCHVHCTWNLSTTLSFIARTCARSLQSFNQWALIPAHGLLLTIAATAAEGS